MQITLEGKTMDEVAIERIREHEPPEGYYLGFSGGVHSVCLYDLTIRSGARFDAHYNQSPLDPPEVRQFIKDSYPNVIWDNHARNFWKQYMTDGPPMRISRWCCDYIKHAGGQGRIKLLGMLAAESSMRHSYQVKQRADWVLPIVDWGKGQAWLYIEERQLKVCSLYDEGFHRIGCVLCPMLTARLTQQQIERWPKIALAWRRASDRYFYKRIERGTPLPWDTPEEFWQWWIGRK